MLFKRKTDWNLLAKYMAGETNEIEAESVLSWAESNPLNKTLLKEIKSDWQKMDSVDERFNVDHAWEKLHGRITGQPEVESAPYEIKTKKIRKISFSTPVRIAASLLLLAILGVAIVSTTGVFQRISIATANNEKDRVIELPDGSRVYLNGGTELSYSRNFTSRRNIKLTGEAYFEVAPDKAHPFRINAENAVVEVVGTAFNVNTRKSNGSVEVYVESGIVEISGKGDTNDRLMLQPGNIGTIGQKSISKKQAENANSVAWKTGAMTFIDVPLIEAIALLNNVYNVNIRVTGDAVDTILINGSYNNDPLDVILQTIAQHNPQLTIAKSEDTIYLSQ